MPRPSLPRCLLLLSLAGVAAGALAAGPPLVWRGDVTTARGFVEDVARAWDSSGHARITLQPFNTISGIDAVANGSADVAGSARGDAPGRADESSLTFTPVAWDALVMVTHPGNPVHSISLKQLHDIYYGRITNWSELGGRDGPIDLYAVASPSDGVEFSLRRLLFGRGNQPVAAPRLYVNVAKLEEGVTLDPRGLGATTWAGAHGNPKLQVLAIDGVMPSQSSVASGRYPLYTPLYLVTNGASPHAAEAQQFVDFMQTPKAEAVMRQHQLVPYGEATALAAREGQRMASIAAEVGRSNASSTPIAAPGATYAAGAALAPTSQRTAAARQAMLARNAARADQRTATRTAAEADSGSGEALNAEQAPGAAPSTPPSHEAAPTTPAAPAKASFAGVQGHAMTSARPGFGGVEGKVLGKTTGHDSATYTVSQGDTLYSIAHTQGVTVAQIRAWNHLRGDDLQAGQVLRVR